MPLYDFECNACGHIFEELVFENDERPPCQKCGDADTAQRMSAPSPLKTNPFPYKVGKTMPQMPKLNRTCPNASSCGQVATIGGGG